MDRKATLKGISTGIVFSLALGAPMQHARAALNLSDTPLTVGNRVPPNVMFLLDDSGSMDFEILMKPYWAYCAYDPDARNQGDESGATDCGGDDKVTTGRWRAKYNEGDNDLGERQYIYVFATGDNAYGNRCGTTSADNSAQACSDEFTDLDWRVRSADVNVTWFDGDVTYQPWIGYDDAAFGNARSHPDSGAPGYDNTRNLDGFVWYEWLDGKGYSDDRPHRGARANMTDGNNGEYDLWDDRIRYEVNGNTIERTRIETETVADADFEGDYDLVDTETSLTSWTGEQAAGVKQNIANWYQYHRRRTFIAGNAIADVITNNPGFRYGLTLFEKSKDFFIEVPEGLDGDYQDQDDALLDRLLGYSSDAGGTYLRTGLDTVGQYYSGNRRGAREPIAEACQKNFTVLLSDGYWAGNDPRGIGNEDGDPYSKTAADVAAYYYNRDLSDLPDDVPADEFDGAEYQHMNTFTVAFGVEGLLQDDDGDGWPEDGSGNQLDSDDDWGDVNVAQASPERIDDLWHAAWNSRGAYVNAQTPGAVNDGLRDALGSIARRSGASSSVAANSTSFSTNQAIFQGRFVSGAWTGELRKLSLDSDGIVDGLEWKASDGFPAPGDRDIFTTTPPGSTTDGATLSQSGVEFLFSELAGGQQTALNTSASGTADGRGAERVDYLRGDRTNEGSGGFRVRQSVLGDIVNSNPRFSGPANYGFRSLAGSEGESYLDYVRAKRGRTDVVYVGANDGMLHAFDADNGEELFAYVPNEVVGNLSALTDPKYAHRFYVDGSPHTYDAYVGGEWRTILVGTTGRGGNSVFALDVSEPESFASTDVLWEFTHPELGKTLGKPSIIRMPDGTWAAIFGNGYNSDGHKAKLFIVPLNNPDEFTVLETDDQGSDSDPNGLASPRWVDTDADGSADRIYAGDLHGRLWRFDLETMSDGELLFQAKSRDGKSQPITTRPDVAYDRKRNLYVFFGTGKYLEPKDTLRPDSEDPRVETIYGLRDDGDKIGSRNDLQDQRIVAELTEGDPDLRFVSEEELDDDDKGWYLDLVYDGQREGERVVEDVQVFSGRLVVNTSIPDSSPCEFGGRSWLMQLDLFTGGGFKDPVFDLNDDGEFDSDDTRSTEDDDNATPAGMGSDSPQTGSTVIYTVFGVRFYTHDQGNECESGKGSFGNCSGGPGAPIGDEFGRMSWQELR